jgi:hypothetical protein
MLLNLTNYKEVFEFTSGEYASWKSIIDIYQNSWITSQTKWVWQVEMNFDDNKVLKLQLMLLIFVLLCRIIS